ncbi:nucleotidyl transferase AbiEii/AbiGii toxin family protein [Candidatus Uhrbacteria bacterium]|nr:nucleotidyl transferase AbiEii/AbiGii toxin family protein [Candidatus Uhrbacteria bacterium]
MSKQLALHLELLDEAQKKIFSSLFQIAPHRYLVGGTALSLQMGHRYSYDFDIFSTLQNTPRLFHRVSKLFPIGTLFIRNEDEYTFLTKTGVKMTFFCYPYDMTPYAIRMRPITLLSIGGVAIAKAFAIGQRNRWRDYLDLYAILSRTDVTLPWMITHAKKTYGNEFSEKLFFGQLLYTKDIRPEDKKATQLVDENITISKLHAFFKKQIKEYIG